MIFYYSGVFADDCIYNVIFYYSEVFANDCN